jgi:hypothetical protein
LAAHFVDYFIFVPDPQHRAALLEATGHSYLAHLAPLAVLWGLLAAATTIWRGSARARGSTHAPMNFRSCAAVLAVAQVSGFVLLEIGERLVSGAGFEHAWPQLFAVGIIVQVAVAVAGAVVLVLLDRGAEIVASAFRQRRNPSRRSTVQTCGTGRVIAGLLAETSISSRGPPIAVALTP